jgi:hypothetical protein
MREGESGREREREDEMRGLERGLDGSPEKSSKRG